MGNQDQKGTIDWDEINREIVAALGGPCVVQKIRWHGEDLLLIGRANTDGAIATRDQFENFECSTAHLMKDGRIRRFGLVVGQIGEIEFGELEE